VAAVAAAGLCWAGCIAAIVSCTYVCICGVFLKVFLCLGLCDLEELLPAQPQAAGEPPGYCYVQGA
jgi:hypothetical protein